MNRLPIHPLSPEEHQHITRQLYTLMGKQVKSYHARRHMGSSTSVPAELAQALLESAEYTLNQAGGVSAGGRVEEIFHAGQAVLEEKYRKTQVLLHLVSSTAPEWQTECRLEALGCLRHYLEHYDHLHLAHRGPDDLFYPILIQPPEGIQGIDLCSFILNILWIENQIMAGIPEDALAQLWDRLSPAALNQCEQLLVNGLGKALLNTGLESLVFTPEEQIRLFAILPEATGEVLSAAAERLCCWLSLRDENAKAYVKAAIPLLTLHRHTKNAYALFI